MHHLSLVVKKPLALNYIELRFSLEKCCLKGGRDDLWSTKDQPKMFAVQQLWWETHLVSIARCARFRAHPCGNWCRATDNPKLSPQMADAIKTDVPTKTSKNHQIIISKKKIWKSGWLFQINGKTMENSHFFQTASILKLLQNSAHLTSARPNGSYDSVGGFGRERCRVTAALINGWTMIHNG